MGLTYGSAQPANGCRGVTVWFTSLLTSFQQLFAPLFGNLNASHQIVEIKCFRAFLVVFRPQVLEHFLHLVSSVRLGVILLVQDQPDLKTRIGSSEFDAVLFATRHRFLKTRMLVTVEDRPHLIAFLERILFAAAVPSEPLRLGERDSLFSNGVGNPDASLDPHIYLRTWISVFDRFEIGRFRIPALAKERETPLRVTAGTTPLQGPGMTRRPDLD